MGNFFLGVHQPIWLTRTEVPLFVSHVRLKGRKNFPYSTAPWALDSGGFSQLSAHGKWFEDAKTYAAAVRRYSEGFGNLQWAAIQDWMCEPNITAKTGKTIEQHQHLTVASYMELMCIAPDLPWVPVLQGQSVGSYEKHLRMYDMYDLDVRDAVACGVGSVCRRQATSEAVAIFKMLKQDHKIHNLHGFGLKIQGLANAGEYLNSADSMAWSFAARKKRNGLQNDLSEALRWRGELLKKVGW